VVNEVFVLADYDALLGSCAFPDHWIVGGVEAQIKDVRGLMPLADNPARQRGRKLSINEKVHAGCKIA
jgi:hypothetical protein